MVDVLDVVAVVEHVHEFFEYGYVVTSDLRAGLRMKVISSSSISIPGIASSSAWRAYRIRLAARTQLPGLVHIPLRSRRLLRSAELRALDRRFRL